MLKRGDSRGLSTIIATLLIIILALVLIGILWVVMRNFILHQSELVEMEKEFFAENIEMSSVKINDSFVSLSLKRTGGTTKSSSQTNQSEIIEKAEVDIISVVDISGSMLGEGLTSAQEANKELINILFESEGNRIGLVGYSTTVDNSASLNLTDNLTQLNNKIDSWHAGGSTCICCGINEAFKKLKQQSPNERAKKIIVMSDGEANVKCIRNAPNASQDAINSSCYAKENLDNLIVYSIGAGENVNEETLMGISDCGGGKYFSAMNISELIDVYRSVAEEIKTTSISVNKFNYLYVLFYNGTSSYKEKISEMPDILAIKRYNFDLTEKLEGNITKIEIYPVIISDQNKEVIGPMFDSWEYGNK